MSASAAVWWIWGILAFASGIAFCHAARSFHRAARQPAGPIRATGQGDSLDALAAAPPAAGPLWHQTYAWPPHTQPPARTQAQIDWAEWEREISQ